MQRGIPTTLGSEASMGTAGHMTRIFAIHIHYKRPLHTFRMFKIYVLYHDTHLKATKETFSICTDWAAFTVTNKPTCFEFFIYSLIHQCILCSHMWPLASEKQHGPVTPNISEVAYGMAVTSTRQRVVVSSNKYFSAGGTGWAKPVDNGKDAKFGFLCLLLFLTIVKWLFKECKSFIFSLLTTGTFVPSLSIKYRSIFLHTT